MPAVSTAGKDSAVLTDGLEEVPTRGRDSSRSNDVLDRKILNKKFRMMKLPSTFTRLFF
jgi:hypothetical protein